MLARVSLDTEEHSNVSSETRPPSDQETSFPVIMRACALLVAFAVAALLLYCTTNTSRFRAFHSTVHGL